jgi:glutamate/tyrosine decarboxylase-like PLP-dependent enzyme
VTLFREVADYAEGYVASLDERRVLPVVTPDELRVRLGGPLPEQPRDPTAVVRELIEAAEPGVVATGSGRYFGFVIGGGVPAAVGADWLASLWDQNAGLYVAGPSASVVEEVATGWLAELLALPAGVASAFVTGCQMAHVTALLVARHAVLERAGWDVAARGLAGSPPLRVVVGEERHVTVDRALRFLGIGSDQLVIVPADGQGRLRAEALELEGDAPTIVCAQLGNVNTGAFDPLPAIADAAEAAGAWLHVDGAFGLWAAASPRFRHLVAGVERADSWATDAHKWLNVPYDSGLAFTAHPAAHRAALGVQAAYLIQSDPGAERDAVDWTPEFSRRARGFAVYAAIRSLGRSGVAELVERCCDHAASFAAALEAAGAQVLNDVVLNQVLVRFGDDARTRAVVAAVQADGTCFVSGTRWQGLEAMRISVSNWQTGADDVDRSVAAILRACSAG